MLALIPIFEYLQYEMKHNFFKRNAHIVCCYKNISKTLAMNHQFYKTHIFLAGFSNRERTECSKGSTVTLVEVPFFNRVHNRQNLNLHQRAFITKKLCMLGAWFRKNDIIVLSIEAESSDPTFAKISSILCVNNCWYFLIEYCKTLGYSGHYHAYALAFNNSFDLIAADRLDFVHALDLHVIDGLKLVTLRHALIT